MKLFVPVAALLTVLANGAAARDYCPDRPGLDTPPCTLEPGALSVETSAVDWTHDTSPDSVSDTILLGDVALRYGIAEHAELRLGWTAAGIVRTRDRRTGDVQRQSGSGDVSIGIKRNLIDPDGHDLSAALLPWISVPTGGSAIGAGDWGGGVQLPINVPVAEKLSLLLTPEIDAAVDSDRKGRHLAYGSAGGINFSASPVFNLAIEGAVMRDDDAGRMSTQAVAGLSAALMVGKAAQVDIGSEFGLNHDTPERRIHVGLARRF